MNLVSVGTINASLVIPREVFKSSILANASAIIGLHNHPSGNVKYKMILKKKCKMGMKN